MKTKTPQTPKMSSIMFNSDLIRHEDFSNHVTQRSFHPLLCLAASLLSRSSAMVRRMPLPRGREIHGLLP